MAILITIAVLLIISVLLPSRSSGARWRTKTIVEPLSNPVAITDWTAAGLLLADGRTVPVPDLARQPLPCEIPSLLGFQKVEVSNGRVYVNLRIHHWCGNDPVRLHIAKVDLGRFLIAGEIAQPPDDGRDWLFDWLTYRGMPMSQHGLRVGAYYDFQRWCNLLDNPQLISTER